jgi:uncharacterized protein
VGLRTCSLSSYNRDMKEALVKLFQAKPEISVALLFGSCANDEQTFNSDIDVAVLSNRPFSSEFKKQLIEELALVTGRSVDLIDLRTVGQPLLGQILKNPIRLKGEDGALATLYVRHVIEVADFMPYVHRTLRERQQAWTR